MMGMASRALDSAAGGNPEAFVRHLVAEAIEAAYREELGCTRVNYYYDVFRRFPAGTDPAELRGWEEPEQIYDGTVLAVRTVWCGHGLIRFIRTVQSARRRRYADDGVTIYATSSHCKGGLRDEWDPETKALRPDDEINVSWIGDVGRDGHMECGSDLFCFLWDHVLDRAAKRVSEE